MYILFSIFCSAILSSGFLISNYTSSMMHIRMQKNTQDQERVDFQIDRGPNSLRNLGARARTFVQQRSTYPARTTPGSETNDWSVAPLDLLVQPKSGCLYQIGMGVRLKPCVLVCGGYIFHLYWLCLLPSPFWDVLPHG